MILRKQVMLVAAVVGAVFSVSAQDEEIVPTIDSSLVIVNATISDRNGRHAANLKKEEFKIFENGVEQRIEFFTAEETPFAAVILLDTSGSMEERVSVARSAAIRFLDCLRPDDSAAIYKFDSNVALVQDFSSSRFVSDRVFNLKSYGMTVLYDAIYKAAEVLKDRPERRRAIVVLSDGEDTQSGRSAERALRAAQAVNALIYTVDMSSPSDNAARRQKNNAVLRNFAGKTGGMFIETPGGAAMREAFERIVTELGTQYTLGYQPSDQKMDGKWRSIELRVARPNLTIRTRKGYNADKK
jgi:Ca-activated chloride channel family protein